MILLHRRRCRRRRRSKRKSSVTTSTTQQQDGISGGMTFSLSLSLLKSHKHKAFFIAQLFASNEYFKHSLCKINIAESFGNANFVDVDCYSYFPAMIYRDC